jgi:hypothetical protein
MRTNSLGKCFKITSICKDDMREAFSHNRRMLEAIEKFDDNDMKQIARKMADNYLEFTVNFWDSLETVTENFVRDRKSSRG